MESLIKDYGRYLNNIGYLVAAFVTVVLLIIIIRIWIRQRKPLAQISRIVRKSGVGVQAQVLLPGVDGQLYTADYLIMTPCGIWLLDVLDFEGLIFGGAETDDWTQVIGRKSFRFTNPLHALRDKRIQLQAMSDLEEIKAAVVFTRAGCFPKDRPGGTVQQQDLAQLLVCPDQDRKKQQNTHLQRAWDLLVTELNMN
ncbi:MAG TPA: NERD domain-containing protein [Gammaproteobacteria bacterium]|nr:NERD domain-containing protein [Gammaproteobacteria bacterium]